MVETTRRNFLRLLGSAATTPLTKSLGPLKVIAELATQPLATAKNIGMIAGGFAEAMVKANDRYDDAWMELDNVPYKASDLSNASEIAEAMTQSLGQLLPGFMASARGLYDMNRQLFASVPDKSGAMDFIRDAMKKRSDLAESGIKTLLEKYTASPEHKKDDDSYIFRLTMKKHISHLKTDEGNMHSLEENLERLRHFGKKMGLISEDWAQESIKNQTILQEGLKRAAQSFGFNPDMFHAAVNNRSVFMHELGADYFNKEAFFSRISQTVGYSADEMVDSLLLRNDSPSAHDLEFAKQVEAQVQEKFKSLFKTHFPEVAENNIPAPTIDEKRKEFFRKIEADISKKAQETEDYWVRHVRDARPDDPGAGAPHPSSCWRGDYY